MEYEYNDFFKITDLNDIQSTDFIAHIPIYVKAQRDALVLFTTGPKAMRSDNEYEIGKISRLFMIIIYTI